MRSRSNHANRMSTVPDRIRVLRVIARLNVGGPARHVALLSEMDGDEFETLVAHGCVGPGEAEMIDDVQLPDSSRILVPELGPKLHWRQDLVAFGKLLGICRRFRPHIIHTHTAKAGTLGRLAGALYALSSRQRCHLVHTFHGHVFEHYFSPSVSAIVRGWERLLAMLTDRIVVLGPRQHAELIGRFAITQEHKVCVIPLGLDLESLDLEGAAPLRASVGCPADTPLIGIIGRLVPVKNHDLFLKACRRLLDCGTAAHFVIIGGGSREAELRRLSGSLRLEEHVTFLGWRRDLGDVYRSLDVVALTSRNEGTPVALIEAMAMGRAVIATRIGGVEDVIEDQRTGLLVESGDVEAFAAGMVRLARDRRLRERLGSAARVSVLHKYSKRRLIADVSAMYRELITSA
jgi:glycosyltransferase involved in cell wall biosynthesis